jgi:hypothetical protein
MATEINPIREAKETMLSDNKAFNIVKWNGEEIETVCYATTREQFQEFVATYPHESLQRISYDPRTREFMFLVA